jgi:hypothetical protein
MFCFYVNLLRQLGHHTGPRDDVKPLPRARTETRRVRLARWSSLTLLVAVTGFLAACGGAGEGKEPESRVTATGVREHDARSTAAPRAGSKAAAPGVPTSKGGDNSIQTWGLEATSAQRERLAAIVQAFLDARAGAEWGKACSYLAAEQHEMLEQLAGASGSGACAKAMGLLAAEVPASAFAKEAEIVDVLSLRIGGGHAFLIYTRPEGKVYATALGHESGSWKVISVGPTALN